MCFCFRAQNGAGASQGWRRRWQHWLSADLAAAKVAWFAIRREVWGPGRSFPSAGYHLGKIKGLSALAHALPVPCLHPLPLPRQPWHSVPQKLRLPALLWDLMPLVFSERTVLCNGPFLETSSHSTTFPIPESGTPHPSLPSHITVCDYPFTYMAVVQFPPLDYKTKNCSHLFT